MHSIKFGGFVVIMMLPVKTSDDCFAENGKKESNSIRKSDRTKRKLDEK